MDTAFSLSIPTFQSISAFHPPALWVASPGEVAYINGMYPKGRQWKAALTRELRRAEAQLNGVLIAPARNHRHDPIHEARKSIKILRAAFRLLRAAFPADTLRAIHCSLRDAGRAIGPLRDREALWKTRAKLAEKAGTPPPKAPLPSHSRRPIASALRHLKMARQPIATLTWEKIDRGLLRRGLQRLYRRGKRAAEEAEAKPSDDRLHAWRKRTKDLGYALRLLGLAATPLEKKVQRLAEHLGDDHDLAMVQENHLRHDLRRPVRQARRKHRKKAFHIGHRLFSHRSGHFISLAQD